MTPICVAKLTNLILVCKVECLAAVRLTVTDTADLGWDCR